VLKIAAFLQDSRGDVDHAYKGHHREVRDEIKDLGWDSAKAVML